MMITKYQLEKEFIESRVKAQELLDNNDEELTEEAREKIKDVIKIIDKMEEKGPQGLKRKEALRLAKNLKKIRKYFKNIDEEDTSSHGNNEVPEEHENETMYD